MRVGLCCSKHCTFVWGKPVPMFPAISTHQHKQGKERAQSSRSLPQGSQSLDYNSPLKHQNLKKKKKKVFQMFSKAWGGRRRGKLRGN